MVDRPYQICANCVMDTSDSRIRFDERGVCDHCNTFYSTILPNWHTDERGAAELQKITEEIKEAGRGKDFDCIIGMSGGIDSSYLTYLAKEKMGLRPLVFHVDAGWNSQEAVNNIEKLVDKLGLDLFTEVIDWEEMRDLQLAFFKAGVPHIDTPDCDGVMKGYDLELATQVRNAIGPPLTILGGAGSLADIQGLIQRFGIIGASAGSLFVSKGVYRAVLINHIRAGSRRCR